MQFETVVVMRCADLLSLSFWIFCGFGVPCSALIGHLFWTKTHVNPLKSNILEERDLRYALLGENSPPLCFFWCIYKVWNPPSGLCWDIKSLIYHCCTCGFPNTVFGAVKSALSTNIKTAAARAQGELWMQVLVFLPAMQWAKFAPQAFSHLTHQIRWLSDPRTAISAPPVQRIWE